MRRSKNGSTMVLNVALTFVILIIGVFIFNMMMTVGGAKEHQNLTDSGALNVGKQALTAISTPLNGGFEQANFSSVSDGGNVDLKTYNRIVAKTYLIGLNAQAMLNDPESQSAASQMTVTSNVQQLFDAVQGGPTSIAGRLSAKLSDPISTMPIFMNVAQDDSLRMLKTQGQSTTPTFNTTGYGVSCMSPGGNTNVYIDPSMLPATYPAGTPMTLPKGVTGSKGPSGMPYLSGYTDLNPGIPGCPGCVVQGASLMPGTQPHLIAGRDFTAGVARAKTNAADGSAPPNAFQVSCKAGNNSKAILTTAYSIVGALGNTYQASLADGYIKVYSAPGSPPTTLQNWINYTGSQGDFDARLVQRMREINPKVTPTVASTLLSSNTINPGDTWYIYQNPIVALQNTTPLVMTRNKPPSFIAVPAGPGQSSDGGPVADGPLNHYCPTPADHSVWYAGSGVNNKLGTFIIWGGEDTPTPTGSGLDQIK